MAENRDIKYINRNFDDFRSQLIEFAKNYFPDTYNDFSPASPGMMFIEMAAYVGDVLSFYQDTQLQETFLQHAKDPANLYSLAYMMGYRPRVTSVAEAELEITQLVDASGSSYEPNWDQALTLSPFSTVTSTTNPSSTFFLNEKVDFNFSSSYDPTDITIYSLDGSNPAEFLLKKKAKAISAEIKTTEFTFDSVEKFATVEIEDVDLIKVLDIVDSDGNTWYEVPFLGQDTIFSEQPNTASDASSVPYVVTLQKVPRRFVTRFTSTGVMQIQFGAGISQDDDTTFLPDPTNVGSKTVDGVSRLDYAYDPSNFLFSRSYGLAPSNTTLTVRYLTGGGVTANVPANTLTSIGTVLTTGTDQSKSGTLAFNNPKAAVGGRDGDTVEELRQNALRAYAEQGRAVTLQDYTVRALSLPPDYGSIAKVFVTQEQVSLDQANDAILDNNPLALTLYTLATNNEGHLTTSTPTLKHNLKQYLSQYMILTDAINIKDAFVVNIGVKFEIITLPNFASRDVLLACNRKLQEYFHISKWNINQPINLSRIYTLLDRVKGVQTVQKVEIVNKQGGNYSEYAYDIKGATKSNVVYPSYDPCIFEVKFPNEDIEGRVTTL